MYRPTDYSENAHTGVMLSSFEAGIFFFFLFDFVVINFFFFHLKIFGRWIFVTNIKYAGLLFLLKDDMRHKKNSTLSLCEI